MASNTYSDEVKIKAGILSHGVTFSEHALNNFGFPFLEKRRAYGNPDSQKYVKQPIPQELLLLPKNIVVSINAVKRSPWMIDLRGHTYYLNGPGYDYVPISFPIRPGFYDKNMSNGKSVSSIITLFGSRSLAVFVYGKCALVDMGKACQYCSIQPNRKNASEFQQIINREYLCEALSIALQEGDKFSQVMVNGGNFSDPDKGFNYYLNLALAAKETANKFSTSIDVHLIVYPPNNLELLEQLRDKNISIAMNVEVFDLRIFSKVCPGKTAVSGLNHIIRALVRAAEIMGKNRVYSIFVGGLEPISSLVEGMAFLAQQNVVPVVNIFHPDPETPMERVPRPTEDYILRAGKYLQDLYKLYDMKAFYRGCARNAIDNEAELRLF